MSINKPKLNKYTMKFQETVTNVTRYLRQIKEYNKAVQFQYQALRTKNIDEFYNLCKETLEYENR